MESVESAHRKTATPKKQFDAIKQRNIDKLEVTAALNEATKSLQCSAGTSTAVGSARQVEVLNIIRSNTIEVNNYPKDSINKTLSTVNRLGALNIPQTPIVNQMVTLNTQEIQTTNEFGRSKTLERPVMKLLEASDKPKIKQSQVTDTLEHVSSSPVEESTALQENKENQKAKSVFPN